MKEIYVGSDQDFITIQHEKDWAILHCCKHPYHLNFVGYRGNLPPNHPQYAFAIRDQEMALNLVDMDKFSEKYLDFNKKMFEAAFDFLDGFRQLNYKILIHCNQGESRGPTLGLLYVSRSGKYNYMDFDFSVEQFRETYKHYNPKLNIYMTVKSLWTHFVKPD